jgi:subtilase family serine protease
MTLALAGGATAALAAPAGAVGRSSIPESHPLWATPQAKVADSTPAAKMSFRVYLNQRDQAGAEALAQSVSDPDSPSYRKYLSADQVRDQFAATDSTVNSVKSWLSGSGFSIGDVPSNKAYVEATGTTDQVQHAFDVSLAKYKVKGQTLRASNKDLSVPASLAGDVLGVIGVDQATSLFKPDHTDGVTPDTATGKTATAPAVAPPSTGFRNAKPCSAYYGEKVDKTDPAYNGKQLPYAPCGYTPAQLRSAYGVDQAARFGATGKGTTVAIVDAFASPTIYQDASKYASINDPANPLKASQFSQHVFPPTPGSEDPTACDASGWYGEETLDVEAVHGLAPGANILYVGGADCQDTGLDAALNYVVAGHKADIISNSYGDTGEDIPADEVQAFNQISLQAVMEGIGVYFSSGDNGDEVARLGTPSPDYSASAPWVTAVGGTSLAIGKDGKKEFETGWETSKSSLTNGAYTPASYTSGAGGGTSRLFPQPFYQKGVVPDSLSKLNQTGNTKGRTVPDISAIADPNTGFLVGQTQTFPEGVSYDQYRIGGTSLASPVFAGIMAVADSFDHFHHGFINPVIYKLTSKTSAISDIKHVDAAVERVDYANSVDASGGLLTSVRTLDYQGLTINTTKGYDTVTGLGSPNGLLFLLLV